MTAVRGLDRGLGGWGGIRTHETVARLAVFKTAAFDHSATHPWTQAFGINAR